MKLNEIESFVAVAETGSIQDAARRLHLTQSAVSRVIQRFEKTVGSELFDRRSKPFRMTRAGENALVHCRRVLRAVDDFSSAFSDEAVPAGPFRLGLSHALSSFVARGPVEQLRRSFPDISVRIMCGWSNAHVEAVRAGELEAAAIMLSPDAVPPGDLSCTRLFLEPVRIIAARNTPDERLASLESMNDLGWVLLPDGCRYRSAMARAYQRRAREMNIAVESLGQEMLLSLVARGAGLGLSPVSTYASSDYARQIRVIDTAEFRSEVACWLVRSRHPGRFQAALDVFETGMRELIRQKDAIDE